MSARATSPKDKAVWLKLASDWSNLAENAERKGHSRL